jgi:hypothetical protein
MIGSEVYFGRRRTDLIMIDNNKGIGMVMEFKYDKNAQDALKQAECYLPHFSKNKKIKTKILLGVNVSPEKKVKILMKIIE